MKKRILITLLVSVIVFSGAYLVFGNYLDILDANSPKEVIRGVDLGEGNVIEPAVDGELLFLLAGIDENDIESGQEFSRTDALMLVKSNFETGEIDLISIPRDSYVPINGVEDKINHAHAFGGMALTMRTIRDWMGIDLDYYVKVDFDGVIKIVEDMGGLEINVPQYIELPNVDFYLEPGPQKLTGTQVMYLSRFRGYEDGDFGRVKMQQLIVKEVIKQSLSLENIPKLPDFIRTYGKYVDTNIPTSMMMKLLPAAKSMDTENMNTYYVPGEVGSLDGVSYIFYDYEATQALVDDILGEYKIHQLNEGFDDFEEGSYEPVEGYEYNEEDDYWP